MKKIAIPSGLWYENREWELTLPERWQVDNLNPPGFDKPGLAAELIREKIEIPIAGPSLEEMARGKRQAVIVFDDMTRPTPVREIAPHILDCLHRAGMQRSQIRFLWALGSHGTFDMINARKKLGGEIVEKYAVFNHDPFQNVVCAGRTPTGVELWFNREFMACDLKIGIGCVSPHVQVGFGGGAKIILPGVAGIESIVQFHNQYYRDRKRTGFGTFEDNIMLAECNAAGDIAGLNFKADCLINRRGEITDLYAGDFRATHAAGAKEGKEHYGFPHAQGYDLVICNSYGKANESAIALLLCLPILKRREGTVVLISDTPEGQIPHYVMRSWGSDYGGRHYIRRTGGFVRKLMRKLIVMAPQPDCTSLDLICHNDDAVVVKTWPEVLAILEADFPGEARVAVIQDGTMQYMKPKPLDA
jgi:lactate racemase